ncbi:pyridoxamine 5'-phosphate oxidase family protein [Marivita sp. S0852]|uniref:pyridoxamine 5'-phosphate oxidase family protein n=1 Tax=Marivita sp. S0852 TaxID=3373893 RepID=UPI003982AB74
MSDPNDLAAFLDLGWQRLTRGVQDRRAAARHPVFATVSTKGLPEARTVVLRAADRGAATVEIHTDSGSGKMISLRQTPVAQLHIWDEKARLQIRLSTSVEINQGASVAQDWARVPEGSRMAYGASPKPGSPIARAHAYTKLSRESAFAVLICTIREIELMQLSDPHRRAVFKAETGWQGGWIVP